jgi:hypothetical protein
MLGDVTPERVGEAMTYLATTDPELARLRADLSRAKILAKQTRAMVFLHSTGSIPERQAQAETYIDVKLAEEDVIKAEQAVHDLEAKRETEQRIWDTWRTIEASRRRA